MKVFNNTKQAAGKITNPVVTTGSFDGVHIGHKVIINRLNQIARQIHGESVLITFFPHPRKVLYPDQKDLKLINTQEEKIELLAKAGLDNLIIIPFSVEFSKTSSEDFIRKILIEQLQARVVVIGHNHHFGHNRQGDFSHLHHLSRQLGFEVEEIPMQDIENETVSSTKIRKALMQGNIQRANAYLDHQYIVKGLVTPGKGISQLPGQATFQVVFSEPEKLIPPPGIYATNLVIADVWVKSMTFVMENTENDYRWMETHLLVPCSQVVNHQGTLYFYKKVSGVNLAKDEFFTQEDVLEAKEMVNELMY
ncbi:MAG: riboflavin biosynthesis protein RibF [Bacteroidales bacterium]